MSTIAAQCPSCGRKGNVPDKALGRQVKCPGCAKAFTVAATNGTIAAPAATSKSATGEAKAWFADKPAATAAAAPPASAPSADGLVLAQCTCGFQGRVPERYQGKQVKCRQCNQMFTVAGGTAASSETQPAPASGPSAKMGDMGDIALVPLDDEKPADADADVTECEVVEEVEVVGDCTCPVCGNTVKPPKNFSGKKLRCPQCCMMFNVDGSADDGAEEAPPKKTGGSQAGVKKAAAAAPPEEAAPAEEPGSPFANLDAPEPKRKAAKREAPQRAEAKETAPAPAAPFSNLDEPEPKRKAPKSQREDEEAEEERRPAFKSKRSDDEEAKRQSTLILVAGSGVAILVLAGGLALVAAFVTGEKEKAVAKASTPEPVVATRPQPTPPPTFQRPPTVVRKDPVDPPVKKDPPPDPKDPRPVKPGEWADVSVAACRFGNARLRVTSVWVDDVKMLLRGKAVDATEDVLVIAYELENINEKDPINFFGWGSHQPKPGDSAAVLTDSKGLPYKRLVFEDVEGQIQAKTLDPGQRVPDRLLFVCNDDKADYYRLELPASNFGGEGMVRLHIPRSMVVAKVIRKDPDPLPKDDKKLATLRTQLRSKLAPDRIRACDEISKLRGDGAAAVPDLIKLYGTEKNENVKVAILDAFKWIGPAAKEAVPLLVRALKDEFWKIRREAAEALGTVGAEGEQAKQALPLLKAMLTSKDEGVADAARGAIRRLEKK